MAMTKKDLELLEKIEKYDKNLTVDEFPNTLKAEVVNWYLEFAGAETEPQWEQDSLIKNILESTAEDLVEMINM